MIQILPDGTESVLFALRDLYGRHGYQHYKMNKFEEYDLYAHNKDFLISDSVITFTDGNGKLLALKPDVTLSIVKNSADRADGLQKVYYNENVYRIGKGSRNFKEIMQIGLECIGRVDRYCIYEVLKLALRSLDAVSPRNQLSVSHLGILSEIIDGIGVPGEKKEDVFRCIGEKNLHELSGLLAASGIAGTGADLLRTLVGVRGKPADLLPSLLPLLRGNVREETLEEWEQILTALSDEENVCVDFSTVGDIHYYNGFVFKGFVEGVPSGVLSGGQYDLLMRRMGRSSSAIGFAVYPDTLGQFLRKTETYDVDTVLLYDTDATPAGIGKFVAERTAAGESVRADRVIPEGLKYRRIARMKNGEVTCDDTDA